ncbi:flavodoxin family protein [Nocardioides zhouii]|uniref:Flavodoxin n=1 Tax=Nocardioides zhouii TaxID=1168729 RepID=A0A4Q2T9Y1_9ACTN|nr:flavodoxin family protein [Nocardioides zhouii]RYC13868.1 flavodoxin [Nocardioides zhouii]
MKVVVVHESMFGNTAGLAAEVSVGLVAAGAEVVSGDVTSIPGRPLPPCDLVVLGAPTHAFTLSRPASRTEAVAKGAQLDRATMGLREWLAGLQVDEDQARLPRVALFDTRVSRVRHLPGSAARSAARILGARGFTVVDRSSFYVDGISGPVHPGERERARAWGETLVEVLRADLVAARSE